MRIPVVTWWAVLLLAALAQALAVHTAESRLTQAADDLATARGLQQTTRIVDATFVSLGRVTQPLPFTYEAKATYRIDDGPEVGAGSLVEVGARADGRKPTVAAQPRRLQLRVQMDRGEVRVVQHAVTLRPADELVTRAVRSVAAAEDGRDRAGLVGLVAVLVALLVTLVASVVAWRRPGGLWTRFAGTRSRADAPPDQVARRAHSVVMPTVLGGLAALVLLLPIGWSGRVTAIWSSVVALVVLALLVREVEAVGRARRARVPVAADVRTWGVWLRASSGLGIVLGVLLMLFGLLELSTLGTDRISAVARGLGVLLVSAVTLATVPGQLELPSRPRH